MSWASARADSEGPQVVENQPGLEVVATTPGLEVAHGGLETTSQHSTTAPNGFPEYYKPENVGHSQTAYYNDNKAPAYDTTAGYDGPNSYENRNLMTSFDEVEQQTTKPKSRKWLYVGIAIALLVVIVGAVVGGVLGSQAANSGSSDNNDNNESDGSGSHSDKHPGDTITTPTVTLEAIRPDSKLSVVGWYDTNDVYSIRVFYQNSDALMQYSEYSSAEDSWTDPVAIDVKDAMDGTSMATTGLISNDPFQIEHFYLSRSSLLSGQNFQADVTADSGLEDSIDQAPFKGTSRGSSLAAYWPFIASQDASDGSNPPPIRLTQWPWPANDTLDAITDAAPDTPMAIVPQTMSHEGQNPSVLFYRMTEGGVGALTVQAQGSSLGFSNPPITIPETTSFAAFAIGNSVSGDSTAIYIVYQVSPSSGDDTDTSISSFRYVFYDGTQWQGPYTSAGLGGQGADLGTDIACVTETAGFGDEVLSIRTDISRCYWMSGGRMVQAAFSRGQGDDGGLEGKWTQLENVPFLD